SGREQPQQSVRLQAHSRSLQASGVSSCDSSGTEMLVQISGRLRKLIPGGAGVLSQGHRALRAQWVKVQRVHISGILSIAQACELSRKCGLGTRMGLQNSFQQNKRRNQAVPEPRMDERRFDAGPAARD